MALFFRQRKPRGFNYTPRYYDPEQEAREERKKIVLGDKYKAPVKRGTGDVADAAGCDDGSGTGSAGSSADNYVPGSYVREHAALRRGNAHAAETMRRRRRKQRSVYVLVGMLALIVLIVWMMYFR